MKINSIAALLLLASSSISNCVAAKREGSSSKVGKKEDKHPCPEWLDQTGAYEALSAKDKEACVMKMVMATAGESVAYNDDQEFVEKILHSDLRLVFGAGDKLPYDKKLFHTSGVIASVKFESTTDHPYTGLYQGAPYGLVRMGEVHGVYQHSIGGMTYGAAFKFFKDGMVSADLLTGINHPQVSGNFFEQTISNNQDHSLPPTTEPPAKTYWRNLLLTVTLRVFVTMQGEEEISRLGIAHLATHSVEGEEVPEEDVKSPFSVQMWPNEDLKEQFSSVELGPNPLETTFSKIPKGTVLYTVYAKETPDSELKEIGVIKTKSEFTDTLFGDNELRFSHFFPSHDELKESPELVDSIPQEVLEKSGCHFLKFKAAALKTKALLSE